MLRLQFISFSRSIYLSEYSELAYREQPEENVIETATESNQTEIDSKPVYAELAKHTEPRYTEMMLIPIE